MTWRLKALREAAGLSLREMADELNVPLATYRHYEDRYKRPYLPVDKAQEIARVLSTRGILPEKVMALTGVGSGPDSLAEEKPTYAPAPRRPDGGAPPAEPPLTSLPMGEIAVDLRNGPAGRYVEIAAKIDKDSLGKLRRLREQIDLIEQLLKD